MVYLDTEHILIPRINTEVGDQIKFVNQTTKDEVVCELSCEDLFYFVDSCTNMTGQYDYFIYAGNSP